MTSTAPSFSSRTCSRVPVEVLDAAVAAADARAAADVSLLVAGVEWAEAHVVSDVDDAAVWGDPRLGTESVALLAGPGAPMVSEFAPLEFAGRLGWSREAAKSLIGDGLELKYRLPRLWGLVLEQVVSVRVARHIASCTTDLSFEAAKQADRLVCADPARVSKVKAEQLVDEIRLWFDPDRAIDDENKARDQRGVFTRPGAHSAVTEMTLILDTPDAQRFEHTIADVARELKHLGDTDGLDARRAKAVGVLAEPQQALSLLTEGTMTPGAGGPARVVVHITQDALARTGDSVGATSVEKLGAVSTNLIRDWLTGSTVVIRPVLDLSRVETVAQHDPPGWMREVVIQRDAHCVFPGCRHDSRSCDLDHITPYDTGGDTNPLNLAPLCRTHHRAKTHGDYTYQREPHGTYVWRLPHGDQITVTPVSRKPPSPTAL